MVTIFYAHFTHQFWFLDKMMSFSHPWVYIWYAYAICCWEEQCKSVSHYLEKQCL